MAICYDLRFPELFRILALRGARVLALPSAFTLATTRDHWEVLCAPARSRTSASSIAANQIGEHAPGKASGGRSLIVDPWGTVLATAPDARGLRRRRARLRAPGRDPRADCPRSRNRRPRGIRVAGTLEAAA